ncbi:hypothetical protein CC2G_004050 [Coprinopsis cinerea AmutBmut pab1-1]|nr:hypothetical protein CC2G_004050 [Coprinopsis cinerea AmutBmut pab1-1]
MHPPRQISRSQGRAACPSLSVHHLPPPARRSRINRTDIRQPQVSGGRPFSRAIGRHSQACRSVTGGGIRERVVARSLVRLLAPCFDYSTPRVYVKMMGTSFWCMVTCTAALLPPLLPLILRMTMVGQWILGSRSKGSRYLPTSLTSLRIPQ